MGAGVSTEAKCREIRKNALCGRKPGGADAYSYRESCVSKNINIDNNVQKKEKKEKKAKIANTLREHERVKKYIDFVIKDLERMKARY